MGIGVSTLIHSVRLIDDGRVTDDAWVLFEHGRVSATGAGRSRPAADRIVDGEGGCLTPGFVDIHGHGGAGVGYEEGPEAIRTARALHRAHGTTRAVISLVTGSIDDLAASAAMVADLAAEEPTILGSHLEGPFLDPAHKGAHDAAWLRTPDPASIDRLLAAGRGTIAQVTIAPELPGAVDAIARFVAAGVVTAVGHTGADHAVARRAFDAGATVLTHAFNAMPGIHHRAPGPVVAAMRDPRVTLELIADGVHVDGELIGVVFAAAGGRVALVTDAMAAAGAGDGCYGLGGLAVTVVGGVARLDAGGTIAGSTLTQDAALRLVVGTGVPLATAVAALTSTPARAIGRPDLGRVSVGSLADAVLLDDDLQVRRVWVDGDDE